MAKFLPALANRISVICTFICPEPEAVGEFDVWNGYLSP